MNCAISAEPASAALTRLQVLLVLVNKATRSTSREHAWADVAAEGRRGRINSGPSGRIRGGRIDVHALPTPWIENLSAEEIQASRPTSSRCRRTSTRSAPTGRARLGDGRPQGGMQGVGMPTASGLVTCTPTGSGRRHGSLPCAQHSWSTHQRAARRQRAECRPQPSSY